MMNGSVKNGEKMVNGSVSNGDAHPPPTPMWTPHNLEPTQMDNFREVINKNYKLKLKSYDDLYMWSTTSYKEFWSEFLQFSGMECTLTGSHTVVHEDKPIEQVPRWFPGVTLNYAQNLLKHRNDDVALYYTGEGQDKVKSCTFNQLYSRVAHYASALKAIGVGPGDVIAGYLPNSNTAVEAMLAATALGAAWTCASPDFGAAGVCERFGQVKPRLLFTVESVFYNNKIHDNLSKVAQVVDSLKSIEKTVVCPFVKTEHEISIDSVNNSMFLSEFLSLGNEDEPLEFAAVPFHHPLFIMFSSGTTGVPKCMVHSHGGTLIQHLKEHTLHGNMTNNDIMFYYTTTGWMMWNWLVTVLAVGASIVLYDGSPLLPTPYAMWDLIDNIGITIFGTSAKWLDVIEKKGVKPIEHNQLKSLRAILSTGSPLKPCSFNYVYRDVKQDVLLGSITGGTDIVSLFCGHNCNLPVYSGEIQCRCLGMAVQSWDIEANELLDESGELVCIKPFPCAPTHFIDDPRFNKYRAAYFSGFPGVWTHGDYIHIHSSTGGITMYGRSDGVLNPNGVRFGSAEIYNIVEKLPEVSDSVCIGQLSEKTFEERVVLFLQLEEGHAFNDELLEEIRATVRKELSIRHVPAVILPIPDIPYTVSGKKVEGAIKKILRGWEVHNASALRNPDSLEHYKNIPQLQGW